MKQHRMVGRAAAGAVAARSRVAAAVCSALVLAGCAAIFDPQVDYKATGKARPLDLPPDLAAPAKDERFTVPDVPSKGSATYSEYAATKVVTTDGRVVIAESTVLPPVGDKLRIDRAGSERWLVIPGTPDQVWPKLKEFWEKSGYALEREAPELGIMETDWREDRAKVADGMMRDAIARAFSFFYSTPEREKYRTRLERGEGGTTEVYISHRGLYEVYVTEGRDQTRWQPRPSDTGLEAEMLRRFMVFLGAEEKRAAAIVASGGQPTERARLTTDGGATSLDVADRFDRAWRRVGLALDRGGFTVEDRNRAQGLFFVRYVDTDAAKKDGEGLFSWLAFWKSKPAEVKVPNQFRILVKEEGTRSRVQVLSSDGALDTSPTAKKILGLLQDQLK